MREIAREGRERTSKRGLGPAGGARALASEMRERMEGNGRRPERQESELDEVMAELRELETESRETLEKMLTEEQIAQLPRGNRQRGRERGDRAGGGVMRQQIIERFDANQDGELDASR